MPFEALDFADNVAVGNEPTLGVDSVFASDVALLFEAVSGDPNFGDDGLVMKSPCVFDLTDDFFGTDFSGGTADLDSTPFDLTCCGGSGFADAGCAIDSFEGIAFDDFGFDLEGEMAVVPVFFVAAAITGIGSGTRSTGGTTGTLDVDAVNCPLAIWRARSFTLTNIFLW